MIGVDFGKNRGFMVQHRFVLIFGVVFVAAVYEEGQSTYLLRHSSWVSLSLLRQRHELKSLDWTESCSASILACQVQIENVSRSMKDYVSSINKRLN